MNEDCVHDWTTMVAGFKYPRKCVKCGERELATEENEMEPAEYVK